MGIVARSLDTGLEPLRGMLQVVAGIALEGPLNMRRKAPHIGKGREASRNLRSSNGVNQVFSISEYC